MLQDAFIFSLLLHRAALFYFGAHIMCPSSDLQYSVMAPLRSRHMATRWGIDATIFPKARERFTFSQHTAFRTRRRKDFSLSHPRGFVAASRPSSNAHAFSMGFRSGEYGGSTLHGTPTAEYAAFAAGLCSAPSPSWNTALYSDAQSLAGLP